MTDRNKLVKKYFFGVSTKKDTPNKNEEVEYTILQSAVLKTQRHDKEKTRMDAEQKQIKEKNYAVTGESSNGLNLH